MDNYTMTEQAYKNGYEQGLKDAVKEGEWIPYHEADIGWDEYGVRCSVCGFEVESQNVRLVCHGFCPKCGARMKG